MLSAINYEKEITKLIQNITNQSSCNTSYNSTSNLHNMFWHSQINDALQMRSQIAEFNPVYITIYTEKPIIVNTEWMSVISVNAMN